MEEQHQITKQWQKLKQDNPRLKPIDIIKKIAKEDKIEPITAVGYARASRNSNIHNCANKLCYKLVSSTAK